MLINYNVTRFLTSSINSNCIQVNKHGIDVAFVGYSNSGKSSVINCLTNRKMLSRFSKYPGSTKMINFFEVNSKLRLVDLPGYGYSTYYKFNRNKLYDLVINYINQRSCLRGLVLLIDIRRLIRPIDQIVLSLSKKRGLDIIILLTKCDKLNMYLQKRQFESLRKQLFLCYRDIKVIIFSSLKNIGRSKLLLQISKWSS